MTFNRQPSIIQYFRLGKPQITLPVSLSAITGYLLYIREFSWDWLPAIAGVFLMAFASSAINQVQDARIDALMPRTRHRPIPSGKVKPMHALLIAILFGTAGFMLLWFCCPPRLPTWLGLITLACYNLVYTPLKRLTAFAVLPGALVGALPPIIGYTAAGGLITNTDILLVACFFFVGQIPHFWLILLKYDKEYQAAGLPTLLQIFSLNQVRIMTMVWVAATTMTGILLPIAGVIRSGIAAFVVLLITLLLLVSLRKWLTQKTITRPGRAFMNINLYYLGMMALLIADALVS